MKLHLRLLFWAIWLLSFAILTPAQPLQSAAKPSGAGSISGRVLIGGKPAPNVAVGLLEGPHRPIRSHTPVMKTVSDREGNFKFEKVPPGDYLVNAFVPGFVNPAEADIPMINRGKPLAIDEDTQITGIELSLTRGAMITGRVTDTNNQPLIEAFIQLYKLDNHGEYIGFFNDNIYMQMTDDQGRYRIYGLPEGRYKISAGETGKHGEGMKHGASMYQMTYHPDTMNEAEAKVIELGRGEEATNIDIKLKDKLKTYTAQGRIVDAGTGNPIARMRYTCVIIDEQNRYYSRATSEELISNSEGAIRIKGLVPGRYAAVIFKDVSSEIYGEPAIFEITDTDVSGIEIKTRRGSQISGTVVIEGTKDPGVLAQIQKVRLSLPVQMSWPVQASEIAVSTGHPPQLAPDGSFNILGLRPGKIQIRAAPLIEKGLSFLRLEHNGAVVQELDVKDGEQLTGVRVVMIYGAGVIRGTIKGENGAALQPDRVYITVLRDGKERLEFRPTVDGRGRFLIEGLPPGDYEVAARSSTDGTPFQTKRVAVTNDAETQVALVINLDTKDKEERDR